MSTILIILILLLLLGGGGGYYYGGPMVGGGIGGLNCSDSYYLAHIRTPVRAKSCRCLLLSFAHHSGRKTAFECSGLAHEKLEQRRGVLSQDVNLWDIYVTCLEALPSDVVRRCVRQPTADV